jgi:hypothetical protein
MVQPWLIASSSPWIEVKDGNPTAMAIFRRHYTARKTKPKIYQFVGPGEKMVLLTADARALFVWRKFIDDSGQTGVNCAVFRNEGTAQSSGLIRSAVDFARSRWSTDRLYTYVDARRVKSPNAGYCFIAAGWRVCGRTKSGLRILDLPASVVSDTQSHLDRCKKELEEIHNMGEQELWLTALGEADWEAESYLILKEANLELNGERA